MAPSAKPDDMIGITGATGFVGAAIVDLLLARGYRVRALVRNPARLEFSADQVETITGGLDDRAALATFVQGVDHVIHCAGLTHARKREDFFRVNVEGAARLARLFSIRNDQASSGRFVHISSLAARQPMISTYAKSKFDSEQAVIHACDANARTTCLILRAPAMYGPRDTATLPFFTGVKRGVAPIPCSHGKQPKDEARASILYVEDFAKAVLTALTAEGNFEAALCAGTVYEVGDEKPNGHSWREIAQACADAQGVRARILPLPKPLLSGWAAISSAVMHLMGKAVMVTPEKIDEFFYPDWAARDNLYSDVTDWRPETPLVQGFQLTSAWYRAHGML